MGYVRHTRCALEQTELRIVQARCTCMSFITCYTYQICNYYQNGDRDAPAQQSCKVVIAVYDL